MAKKGTAQGTLSLDYSAWERGAKAVMRIEAQLSKSLSSLSVAGGNLLSTGITKFASALSGVLPDVTRMATEFDNAYSAAGMLASQLQTMKFSSANNVSMKTAQGLLGDSGKVWDQYAGTIRDASVRWAAASERAYAAWAAVIGKLAPVFSTIMDDIQGGGSYLIAAAEKFGGWIADSAMLLYDIFTSGRTWEAAKLTFEYMVAQGKNLVIALVEAFGKTIPALASLWLTNLGATLKNLFINIPKILGGGLLLAATEFIEIGIPPIWEAFKALAENVGTALTNAAKAFVEMVKNPFEYLDFDKIGEKIKSAVASGWNAIPKSREEARTTGRNLMLSGMEGISNNGKAIAEKFWEAVKTFSSAVKINDVAGAQKLAGELSRLAQEVSRGSGASRAVNLENTTIAQPYKASSLAAVGGGGGVGPTSMMTLADYARQQVSLAQNSLTELKSIRQSLAGLAGTSGIPIVKQVF